MVFLLFWKGVQRTRVTLSTREAVIENGWMDTNSVQRTRGEWEHTGPHDLSYQYCACALCVALCTLCLEGQKNDISTVHLHVISHRSVCLSVSLILSLWSPGLAYPASLKPLIPSLYLCQGLSCIIYPYVCVCVQDRAFAHQNRCILFIKSKQCPLAKITLQFNTYA